MLRLLVTLSKFLLLAIRTGTTSVLIFPHSTVFIPYCT